MQYRWGEDSDKLLSDAIDEVFLGVINESSRVVALYHYGDHK